MKPESLFSDPAVTPFVECPNCRKLLAYGATICTQCREEIDPDYAYTSALVLTYNTKACSSANTIRTAEYGAVIVFLATLAGYWVDPSLIIVNLLTPILSLTAILVWFYRFGRFKLGDEDFSKARRDMRNSLILWIAIITVQLLLLVFLMTRGRS